eukprot:3637751-Rhodomonas_salina.1
MLGGEGGEGKRKARHGEESGGRLRLRRGWGEARRSHQSCGTCAVCVRATRSSSVEASLAGCRHISGRLSGAGDDGG